jgi:hypothetical protein
LPARITVAVASFGALVACGGGGNVSPAASPDPNVILLSTTTLTFASVRTGVSPQHVQVGETGYPGVFSENDTCTPPSGPQLAGVSESSPGNPATYSITPLADGTCVATFTDTNGQTAKVTITVGASSSQSGPRE